MILWGRLNSHNVKKVAWFAIEAGIPHERRDIGGAFGFTDAYLALNPNRLIPTIEDDGFVLWESNAILRYLAARHAPAFWPEHPQLRALGDRWMDWQFSFADAQRDAFLNLVRFAPADRDQAAIERSAVMTGGLMAILDEELVRRPWLSGEDFGIGDIPMGVYAHSWFTLPIERPDRPHVAAWYERLKTRPGYADTVMIPLT
ncbi:glutathione S-transferase family protein [Rhizorhabdus sp. FW153]|uniref:glutathione S-transferase family protein n=1 Tax=Rhizorhabdus sp. FW153 TaxID=3400216 RepID=UPI003CEB284D